jgi:uncharacterized protein YcfL
MRFSRPLLVSVFVVSLSLVGCGSKEPTSVDSGELQQFVEDNAAQLAAEDAAYDAEEAAEDADDE